MYNVQIPIIDDTFVSSFCPYTNFGSDRRLILKNSEEVLTRVLIKFFLNKCIASDEIINAMLCIKVGCLQSKFKFIKIYRNIEDFCYKKVTWNTKPKAILESRARIIDERCSDGYLKLDITNLIKRMIDNRYNNYGIQLEGVGVDFFMEGCSSETKYYPYIYLTMKESIHNKPTLEGLQLQAINKQNNIIESNNSIIFDKITGSMSDYIDYNQDTGKIKINHSGNYFITWWVSVHGTEEVANLAFSLQNDNNSISIQGNQSFPQCGQVIGSGFIQVEGVPEFLSLNNVSEGRVELQYNATSVQANLVILKVT